MICTRCQEWMDRPVVEARGPSSAVALCPHCGGRTPFDHYPLWFITGASGTGKSTLAPLLRPALPDCIVFEAEAIDYWRFREGDGYAPLYDQWLKVAREIASNGVKVVMLGIATPAQLEASSQRMFFSTISVLGLVCDEAVQTARIRASGLAPRRRSRLHQGGVRLHPLPEGTRPTAQHAAGRYRRLVAPGECRPDRRLGAPAIAALMPMRHQPLCLAV